MNQIRTGHFEADGNDVTLNLGFVPDYIMLVNEGAVAAEVIKIEWWYSAGVTKELHHYRHGSGAGSSIPNASSPRWETSGEIEAAYPQSTDATVGTVTVMGDATVVAVTNRMGIKIDASWMDNSDEIYYLAIKSDREVDHGDINA